MNVPSDIPGAAGPPRYPLVPSRPGTLTLHSLGPFQVPSKQPLTQAESDLRFQLFRDAFRLPYYALQVRRLARLEMPL